MNLKKISKGLFQGLLTTGAIVTLSCGVAFAMEGEGPNYQEIADTATAAVIATAKVVRTEKNIKFRTYAPSTIL